MGQISDCPVTYGRHKIPEKGDGSVAKHSKWYFIHAHVRSSMNSRRVPICPWKKVVKKYDPTKGPIPLVMRYQGTETNSIINALPNPLDPSP